MTASASSAPRAWGLIIVGDEIVSGKRQDKHFGKMLELLTARGLRLAWAHYLGDDRAQLTRVLRQSLAGDEPVVCCGGIGATPDDHTRQAAAAALGVALALHPEAAQLITQRVAEMALDPGAKVSPDMNAPENRQRLKMGEFPEGASIIPNPYNRIPGFNVLHHWFVPGFPVMAWPMIEWVFDTHYRHWFHAQPQEDRSIIVHELAESTVTPLMEQIERQFADIRVYSLPSVGESGVRRHIELGVKGPADRLDEPFEQLRQGVIALGGVIAE